MTLASDRASGPYEIVAPLNTGGLKQASPPASASAASVVA